MLKKKALHIVTDATDLIYYPFRTWGFILMVRDLLLEDYYIRTTIDPDTDGSNSCRRRIIRWNSLRLSGYASLALIRHWTIFLLLVHQ